MYSIILKATNHYKNYTELQKIHSKTLQKKQDLIPKNIQVHIGKPEKRNREMRRRKITNNKK